jgi:vacuolar iron transporter family protein
MGLGAWLAAITDRKTYQVEEKRQRRAIREKPAAEEEEIYELFDEYNVGRTSVTPLMDQLVQNFDNWVKVRSSFDGFHLLILSLISIFP